MKKFKVLTLALGLAVTTMTLQSCLDDDDDNNNINYPSALVTVKPTDGNTSFYMQLNDSVTLLPVNMKSSPFGDKEVRALVNYTASTEDAKHYSHAVTINWIDSILTKKAAEDLGTQNEKTYGNDPVEIVKDWVTIAEDGYLTLRFRTYWGGAKAHRVNLVASTDAKNPYKVTFYHDANNDVAGNVGDGLVAFRLDKLPDTQGKTVDLTLEWNSFSGKKTATFKYCTRKATNAKNNIAQGSFVKTIK